MTLWEPNGTSASECKSRENITGTYQQSFTVNYLGCSEACRYYENLEISCQYYSFKGTVSKSRDECNRLVTCMECTHYKHAHLFQSHTNTHTHKKTAAMISLWFCLLIRNSANKNSVRRCVIHEALLVEVRGTNCQQ